MKIFKIGLLSSQTNLITWVFSEEHLESSMMFPLFGVPQADISFLPFFVIVNLCSFYNVQKNYFIINKCFLILAPRTGLTLQLKQNKFVSYFSIIQSELRLVVSFLNP